MDAPRGGLNRSFGSYREPQTASSQNHTPINWKSLDRTALEIKQFLESVNPQRIGTGFVWYDRTNFTLQPRSEVFSNHSWQKVVNLFNPDSKFRCFQEAMTTLIGKIKEIEKNIQNFNPDISNSEAAKSHLNEWIRIKNVIVVTAKRGFKVLAQNYADAEKTVKATRIIAQRDEAFEHIECLMQELHKKLRPFLSELDTGIIKLEEYAHPSKDLLRRTPDYLQSFRKVSFDPSKGLLLPIELVEQSLLDDQFTSVDRLDLKVAANIAGIPRGALPITTQNGFALWEPMRLVMEKEVVVLQPGIWGTCERTSEDLNICGLHVWSTDTGQTAISCGSLNEFKAKQLVFAMKEALLKAPQSNGRWAFVQLNSFSKEAEKIGDAHTLYLNEMMFQEALGKSTSFLHFNTCLNAATMFESEDRKALKRINIDSLAKLAEYILEDVEIMFKGKEPLAFLTGDDLLSFKCKSKNVITLAKEIKELKQKIEKLDKEKRLKRIESIQNAIDEFVELGDEEENKIKTVKLEKKRQKIEEDLPENVKNLRDSLSEKQEELTRSFVDFKFAVQTTLLCLIKEEKGIFSSNKVSKIKLIFQVYHEILNLQLKQPGYKALSRTTEIELFLLLYRLLKIKPIIFCYSGIDRSGFVRALLDALTGLERELFSTAMKNLPKEMKEEEKNYRARLEACNKLFEVVMQLDESRNELFSLTEEVVSNSKGELVLHTDLSLPLVWQDKNENPIRKILFEKIDEKYPPSMWGKGEILKASQCYMENVICHMLSAGLEISLNSSGVAGLKYLHNASWPTKIFANPHPLARIPMFVQSKNLAIQLVEYSGLWTKTLNFTEIGKKVLLRLSKKRGT